MRRVIRWSAAAIVAVPTATAAQSDSSAWWREAARRDIAVARETMNTKFISALSPVESGSTRVLESAVEEVLKDIERVRDAASYQSVLKRFASAFDDAHIRVRFTTNRVLQQEWPGFLVRFQAGHFTVVESERAEVRVGAAVTACDAKPIDQVLSEIIPYEQVRRHLELESTRTAIGRILFVDAAGSLRPRPTRCRIAGRDVEMGWRPIAADKLATLNAGHAGYSNSEASISPLGANGAWVRMGTFGPSGEAAPQFARIIEQAPSLRDKDVIVFDVRGNGGGSYNWFMGFLDALYGEPYADYYARARLQFANVMFNAPAAARTGAPLPRPQGTSGRGAADTAQPPRTPFDRGLGDLASRTTNRQGTNGVTLRVIAAPDANGGPTGAPPPNPVRARVFVLTDNGCGSACISFVDEMRRFPGVMQIGRDTYVDSRPGSPANFALPSGEASISAPSMTREVRQRGDNFAWKPDIYFNGDIADTQAVRAWVLDVLMKTPP